MSLQSNWSLLSYQLSYVMAGWRYFVCPVEFNNDSNSFQVDCEPSELFQLQDYALPSILESVTGWVRFTSSPAARSTTCTHDNTVCEAVEAMWY